MSEDMAGPMALVVLIPLGIAIYIMYVQQNALSYGCSADCSATPDGGSNPDSNNLWFGRKIMRVLMILGLVLYVLSAVAIILIAFGAFGGKK